MTTTELPIDPLKQFFEETPIGVQKDFTITIGDHSAQKRGRNDDVDSPCVMLPRTFVFCAECEGYRNFDVIHVQNPGRTADDVETRLLYVGYRHPIAPEHFNHHHTFVRYRCGDCRKVDKTYALLVEPLLTLRDTRRPPTPDGLGSEPLKTFRMTKVGEVPKPTKPINSRIKRLIRKEWELYRKGADDEAAGNGIGAFAYYRRVVENSRDILIDAICETMQKLGENDSDVAKIRELKSSRNFSEAVDGIKHLIPQSLYLAGRDPLTALYGPLSDGLHNRSDAECLDAARSIRVLLDHFGERLQEIIENEDSLRSALLRLDEFHNGGRVKK